jgi:hypothetical protein
MVSQSTRPPAVATTAGARRPTSSIRRRACTRVPSGIADKYSPQLTSMSGIARLIPECTCPRP